MAKMYLEDYIYLQEVDMKVIKNRIREAQLIIDGMTHWASGSETDKDTADARILALLKNSESRFDELALESKPKG